MTSYARQQEMTIERAREICVDEVRGDELWRQVEGPLEDLLGLLEEHLPGLAADQPRVRLQIAESMEVCEKILTGGQGYSAVRLARLCPSPAELTAAELAETTGAGSCS